MTLSDRPAFAEALLALAATLNEPMAAARLEGYFMALEDLPLDAVVVGIRQTMQGARFFPKPVDIREAIDGVPEANADAAWGELIREVRRVGYLGTPMFSDPRTLRALRETWGSWARLCETLPAEGPELVGWIKHFKSAFRSLETRDVRRQLPATLHPDVAAFVKREHDRILGIAPPRPPEPESDDEDEPEPSDE